MSDVGTSVLRTLNTATVLDALGKAYRPLRIAELQALSRLTRPTVAQAVEELQLAGLVIEGEPDGQPRRGRPASVFQIAPGARPVVGIDLGPHHVKVLVMDLGGRIMGESIRPVPAPRDAVSLLDQLPPTITEALNAAEVTSDTVVRVVTGSPGVIDPVNGRPTFVPSVAGWSSVDLPGRIGATFSCPTTFENDANLAAVAATMTWPDTTLLAIQWGERLGAGLVIGGRLHRGVNGAAGEIGLINVWDDGPIVGEHGRGVLEERISGSGVVARAVHLDPNAAPYPSSVTAVFNAGLAGDPRALTLIHEVADDFVRSIAPVVLAVDPQLVVVGGGVARAGDLLLEPIRDLLAHRTLRTPEVVVSPWADRTVVRGAVELARTQAWTSVLETIRKTSAR
ncbi:MAG: ROK family transcriptional regulator [Nostocoides sp.]